MTEEQWLRQREALTEVKKLWSETVRSVGVLPSKKYSTTASLHRLPSIVEVIHEEPKNDADLVD